MHGFFTIKNIATIGGVILSFVIPHMIFGEDEEYIEVIEPNFEDKDVVEVDPETTDIQPAEEQ